MLYFRYIWEMAQELNDIGMGPTKKELVPFEVIPNEYLYTSVPKFLDSYFDKNNLHQIKKCLVQRSKGWGYENQFLLEIEGYIPEVDKFLHDFPSFPWVNPSSIGKS